MGPGENHEVKDSWLCSSNEGSSSEMSGNDSEDVASSAEERSLVWRPSDEEGPFTD